MASKKPIKHDYTLATHTIAAPTLAESLESVRHLYAEATIMGISYVETQQVAQLTLARLLQSGVFTIKDIEDIISGATKVVETKKMIKS